MRKVNLEKNLMIDSLFEFGELKSSTQYLIVIDRTTDKEGKIEGLQTKNDHCFFLMPDLEEAAQKLRAEIKQWQRERHNWVTVEVHRVKRPRLGDFVLYVRMISPSYTRATKYVQPRLVPEQDYEKLKKYLMALIKIGPYPPPLEAKVTT